ncbi:receptor-like protein 9DC3 [Jatropha curcas]|uniref:receptor-like protein 9DC3 n=1 Tax=Jatropha curcas TaxID=180498 RepID=UPI0018956405|nr:receptor-like protein 9DC3 [Jatropha curcas]
MANNNINGPIPSFIGNFNQLQYLFLSYNNFSGPIPPSFANLSQLFILYMKNNNINGPIPSFIGKCNQLLLLSLSYNNFSGPIPSDICRLSSLWYLSLSNNLLSGQVCQFKYNNTLEYVDLSHNKLSGTIPSSVFNEVDLMVLILSSNEKLTGEIPSAVCESKSLQILDLSSNNFSGPIPQCLGDFSSSLSVLHLGMNNFNGVLPQVFSEGSNVRYLNFNGNQLQGKIPTSISNCKDLEIPQVFSKGSNVRYLNFNGNQLQGKIPTSISNCKDLEILDMGNNEDTSLFFSTNLQKVADSTATIPNRLHGLVKSHSIANYPFPKLRIFDLSNNNFSGPLLSYYFNNFDAMINVDQNMTYMGSWHYTSYDYSVRLTWKGLEIELVKIQTLLTTINLSGNNFTGKIPGENSRVIGRLKSTLKQAQHCLTIICSQQY